jgi:hypothetical protein
MFNPMEHTLSTFLHLSEGSAAEAEVIHAMPDFLVCVEKKRRQALRSKSRRKPFAQSFVPSIRMHSQSSDVKLLFPSFAGKDRPCSGGEETAERRIGGTGEAGGAGQLFEPCSTTRLRQMHP